MLYLRVRQANTSHFATRGRAVGLLKDFLVSPLSGTGVTQAEPKHSAACTFFFFLGGGGVTRSSARA